MKHRMCKVSRIINSYICLSVYLEWTTTFLEIYFILTIYKKYVYYMKLVYK